MPKATFRFYEELNAYLPKDRRKKDFEVAFEGRRSVKHMLEVLGIPHSEIDLVLANGRSVGFGHILQEGDRLSVYPVFESLNIKHITRLRKIPLREIRFIADNNLDGIAKAMRLLGFDVICDPALSDGEIVEISNNEKRIILTNRRKFLKYRDVARAIVVGAGTTRRQVQHIIEYLDI
ncbi:MAG: Mut7-C RNAse domain-containing protein [Thermodesulfobacteriota bacterium]